MSMLMRLNDLWCVIIITRSWACKDAHFIVTVTHKTGITAKKCTLLKCCQGNHLKNISSSHT